jgi:eukaryotic-like serine/threonine-protein kinase
MASTDTALDTARTVATGTIALASTIAATEGDLAAIASLKKTQAGRTTVLPRVESPDGAAPRLVAAAKSRYENVGLLGQGGMGEVALVRDHDIARTVAVKRLLPEGESGGALLRFVDEIRTIGRLEHPNIVPIHDVGVDEDGRYFFVMKHVEGETLEKVIERLDRGDPEALAHYTFERRVDLFLGLLRALEFSHANGVVHRDIKPANVMVGRFGEVVLMDWGIAKPIGSGPDAALDEGPAKDPGSSKDRVYKTRVGSLVGTPAYMSPEQARGEPVDERSDLYSAVVVFHELLALRHYLGEPSTLDEMIRGVLEILPPIPGPFAYPHAKPFAPPAELQHFVRKAMVKDPGARFQSATEMIAALQAIKEGRCSVDCPVTFTKRASSELGRFIDRRPTAAMLSVLAMISVVIAAMGILIRVALR